MDRGLHVTVRPDLAATTGGQHANAGRLTGGSVNAGTTTATDGVVTTAPGAAVTTQDTEITIEEEPAKAFIFDPGTELSDIVDAINAVGAGPADMVTILEALREAGALRAQLIII